MVAELLFIIRRCNAVVCAVVAFLAISRHGKGRVDPTVRVLRQNPLNSLFQYKQSKLSHHDIVGNLLHNAVNGVPNVLLRRDQQGANHQDDKGGLVVQAEDIVVDADGVELDQPLDGAEDVKHLGDVRLKVGPRPNLTHA